MSKTKEAIERKFPRYTLDPQPHPSHPACLETPAAWIEVSQDVGEELVRERNELIDALIEASELVVEIEASWRIAQPKAHKRWRA
jgi:hypothetical protein